MNSAPSSVPISSSPGGPGGWVHGLGRLLGRTQVTPEPEGVTVYWGSIKGSPPPKPSEAGKAREPDIILPGNRPPNVGRGLLDWKRGAGGPRGGTPNCLAPSSEHPTAGATSAPWAPKSSVQSALAPSPPHPGSVRHGPASLQPAPLRGGQAPAQGPRPPTPSPARPRRRHRAARAAPRLLTVFLPSGRAGGPRAG